MAVPALVIQVILVEMAVVRQDPVNMVKVVLKVVLVVLVILTQQTVAMAVRVELIMLLERPVVCMAAAVVVPAHETREEVQEPTARFA